MTVFPLGFQNNASTFVLLRNNGKVNLWHHIMRPGGTGNYWPLVLVSVRLICMTYNPVTLSLKYMYFDITHSAMGFFVSLLPNNDCLFFIGKHSLLVKIEYGMVCSEISVTLQDALDCTQSHAAGSRESYRLS